VDVQEQPTASWVATDQSWIPMPASPDRRAEIARPRGFEPLTFGSVDRRPKREIWL
jgi:hypothetical protein